MEHLTKPEKTAQVVATLLAIQSGVSAYLGGEKIIDALKNTNVPEGIVGTEIIAFALFNIFIGIGVLAGYPKK